MDKRRKNIAVVAAVLTGIIAWDLTHGASAPAEMVTVMLTMVMGVCSAAMLDAAGASSNRKTVAATAVATFLFARWMPSCRNEAVIEDILMASVVFTAVMFTIFAKRIGKNIRSAR